MLLYLHRKILEELENAKKNKPSSYLKTTNGITTIEMSFDLKRLFNEDSSFSMADPREASPRMKGQELFKNIIGADTFDDIVDGAGR